MYLEFIYVIFIIKQNKILLKHVPYAVYPTVMINNDEFFQKLFFKCSK